MNYCKKCGKLLSENAIFCSNCGEKVVDDISNLGNNIFISGSNNVLTESNINYTNEKINNNQEYSNINKESNNINNYNTTENIKNEKKQIFGDIVRYSFGGFLVLGNITDLPKLSGFVGIVAGLSMMPIIIKLLKEKLKISFTGIGVVLPIIMFCLWVTCLPSEENLQNENNESSSNQQVETENNNEISEKEKLQQKWNDYYKKENIKIVETNEKTLHEYGKYYSGLTVLTSTVIEQKNFTNIKAKIEGQENSSYYSFNFKFEDKKELQYYKKGDTIIIIGTVESSTKNTITLNNCHIISSGSLATEKMQELKKNFEQHNNYAQNLKSEISQKGKIGDGYIEIQDAEVIKAHGDKVLVVNLLYKNESDENKEFNYTANVKVFQKGIELESSFMKCSWYNEKYKDNADVELQPGVSVNINKCFLIEDTNTEVEVVIESWLFADMYDKLYRTFKLK